MKTAIRRAFAAPTLLWLLLALLALPAAGAHAAVAYTDETFEAFEAQLNARQIHQATINKRLRTLRLTLTDGRHLRARYPRHQEPRVAAKLKARHVPVTVLSESQAKKDTLAIKKKHKHKLRYIIGGVGIGVIVIVGGLLLYNRRRRLRAEVG